MGTEAGDRRAIAAGLRRAARSAGLNWGVLLELLGAGTRRDAVLALADLVDDAEPPAGVPAQVVEDNLHLLDRNLQLECELARAKAELGRMERGRGE